MSKCNDNIFWNTDKITFGDLPTVQDLLKACDRKLLADVVFGLYIAIDEKKEMGEKRHRKTKKALRSSMKEMLTQKARKSDECCLFPLMLVDQESVENGLPVSMTAECIMRKDFAEVRKALKNFNIEHPMKTPTSYSLAFTPWEEVLGYRTWLKGCKSRLERYLFLANVYWEMTFFGFDKKTHAKRLAREEEQLASDANGEAVSLQVFFKRYGTADYGFDQRPTLEEEFQESVSSFLDRVNNVARYDLCKRIAELCDMIS